MNGCIWLADTWPQALAIQARPGSMPAAARALAALADDIWHAAGDTSADYNWYILDKMLAAALGPASTRLCHLAGPCSTLRMTRDVSACSASPLCCNRTCMYYL